MFGKSLCDNAYNNIFWLFFSKFHLNKTNQPRKIQYLLFIKLMYKYDVVYYLGGAICLILHVFDFSVL